MDINEQMAKLMDDEMAFYDEMASEYAERLTDLRDTRADVVGMREDIIADAGEDANLDPDDVMDDLLDVQNDVMSEISLDDLGDPDKPMPGFQKMYDMLLSAHDKGERALTVTWRKQLLQIIDMYLDAIDTSIAQVEADQALMEVSRLRIETLRTFAGI